MEFGSLLNRILQALLACRHGNTCVVEGKTFCPDCGAGMVFRWVVLKCSGCNQRRPARYWFHEAVPCHSCCSACGEVDYRLQTFDRLEFYQLSQALLVRTVEDEVPFEITEWFRQYQPRLKMC